MEVENSYKQKLAVCYYEILGSALLIMTINLGLNIAGGSF